MPSFKDLPKDLRDVSLAEGDPDYDKATVPDFSPDTETSAEKPVEAAKKFSLRAFTELAVSHRTDSSKPNPANFFQRIGPVEAPGRIKLTASSPEGNLSMNGISLSPDQGAALLEVRARLQANTPMVTLGGYAGSGKSTIIPFIVDEMGGPESTAFCCFTGKAANVLRMKLMAAGMFNSAGYVGTIHGLIYFPQVDSKGNVTFVRRPDMELENGHRITRVVIDEVSMVGGKLLKDLQSFGIQILAVGDPAQLPPVGDDSVIKNPDVLLEKIHRQAEGSPIIQIAQHVRVHGTLPKFEDSEAVRHIGYKEAGPIIENMTVNSPMEVAVLARRNKARVYFNEMLFGKIPATGHTIVCLKNDNQMGLVNGMRGVIVETGKYEPKQNAWMAIKVRFPEEDLTKLIVNANALQFGREQRLTAQDMGKAAGIDSVGTLLDWGTSLTVHKAQGSAFSDVFVSPDPWPWNKQEKTEWRQWLYTAVTRASQRLYILPQW